MWILIRLLISLAAISLKFWGRGRRPRPQGQLEGADYYEVPKPKQKGFRAGVGFSSPVLFRLHEESRWDRRFKHLGLSTELQVGDARFDQRIYIASDHEFLAVTLRGSSAARTAVLQAFQLGCRRIEADGRTLWMEFGGGTVPSEQHKAALAALRRAFMVLQAPLPPRYQDRFLRRAVWAEGLVYALTAYGFLGYLGWIVSPGRVHLDQERLFTTGLITGAVLAGALFGFIVLALRGSSRGHLVVVESALVLLLALPLAGVQAAADLNRGLDFSAAEQVEVRIEDKRITTTRSRRGRKFTHYWLHLEREGRRGVGLPARYKVDAAHYGQARSGQVAVFQLHEGWLGLRWCAGISFHP